MSECLAHGFADAFGLEYRPTYVFFREEGFYPLELKNDEDAIQNALRNEGTLKVVKAIDESVIWEKPTVGVGAV